MLSVIPANGGNTPASLTDSGLHWSTPHTTPHCQSQSNTSLISSDHSLLLHYTGVYPVVVDNMHQCPDSGVFSGQNWEKYYLITGLSAHHWSPQSSSQH